MTGQAQFGLEVGHHTRQHDDFSRARKNSCSVQNKKHVTIRLVEGSIFYFKSMASETGMSYQSRINLYLKNCAATGKRLDRSWKSAAAKRDTQERRTGCAKPRPDLGWLCVNCIRTRNLRAVWLCNRAA